MKAGFAKVCVTPPLGGLQEGLGQRTPTTKVHDDLFVRALHLSHGGKEALIIGCDLLFFERREIDRFKGAIGRRLPLAPGQILLNVSHNHAGPRLTNWAYGIFGGQVDPLYIEQVEVAMVQAAVQAAGSAREVEVFAGMTRTDVPRSRRQLQPDGSVLWKPSKDAPICDALPVCLFKDKAGKVVSAVFSVSCHPSSWYEPEISADFPGEAQRLINQQLQTDGALFLQGAGGDTKPRQVADGENKWKHGTWDDVAAEGKEIADAVIACCNRGLTRYEPDLRCHYEEMIWPLEAPPKREELLAFSQQHDKPETRKAWAADMIQRLDRFGALPTGVPVGLHALQIARGVRMIALEGEPVAELGLVMLKAYPNGVTFPLGYTNGTQLYLTTTRMHREHGYEFDSYYEYHWPAPLAEGEEVRLAEALQRLQSSGTIPA